MVEGFHLPNQPPPQHQNLLIPKASPERDDSPRGGEMSRRDKGDRSVRGGPPPGGGGVPPLKPTPISTPKPSHLKASPERGGEPPQVVEGFPPSKQTSIPSPKTSQLQKASPERGGGPPPGGGRVPPLPIHPHLNLQTLSIPKASPLGEGDHRRWWRGFPPSKQTSIPSPKLPHPQKPPLKEEGGPPPGGGGVPHPNQPSSQSLTPLSAPKPQKTHLPGFRTQWCAQNTAYRP